MKLENQVCSLEIAKKLKNLGVKQDSLWHWWEFLDEVVNKEQTALLTKAMYEQREDVKYALANMNYSAFTVAELGEILPLYLKKDADKGLSFSVETDGLQSYKCYDGKSWEVSYGHTYTAGKTEANARAKMLIYLLENKLIEIKK